MNKILSSFLVSATVLGLGACSTAKEVDHEKLNNQSQYWQRMSASSAVYMQGPKGQQILNRDIGSCVTEVKELERLGATKEAFPPGVDEYGEAYEEDTPEEKLKDFDTPQREGYLLTEVHDYADFESCMRVKGWERVQYLPYARARSARANYLDTYNTVNSDIPDEVDGGEPYSGRVYEEDTKRYRH